MSRAHALEFPSPAEHFGPHSGSAGRPLWPSRSPAPVTVRLAVDVMEDSPARFLAEKGSEFSLRLSHNPPERSPVKEYADAFDDGYVFDFGNNARVLG